MKPAAAVPSPEELYQQGALLAIDLHFARVLRRLTPEPDPLLSLGAALASRAVQTGHVCLDLEHAPLLLAHGDIPIPLAWPSLTAWTAALQDSPAVSDGSKKTPLVLNGGRLYLHRYAMYEQRLASAIEARLSDVLPLDEPLLKARFEHWFGPAGKDFDQQRFGVFLALRQRLAVISGGPGTGKTSTVTRLLLLLQEQALHSGAALRIDLLAPTGKAAQRLGESIDKELFGKAIDPRVLEALPKSATTIHRALGYSSRTPTEFQRNRQNPLSSDVVIVDEASMVDLALMTKLLEAIAPSARLILLGDKDQLASVEAGAIFGDILGTDPGRAYDSSLADLAERVSGQRPPTALSANTTVSPIQNVAIHLTRSFRYAADSRIGKLAQALRSKDADAVLLALRHSEATEQSDEAIFTATDGATEREVELQLTQAIKSGFSDYAQATSPEQRLLALQQFRIVTPHRAGSAGVVRLNLLAEGVLADAGLLRPRSGPYDGQPIMITENDHQLEIFNGDVGVVASNSQGTRLLAYFRSGSVLRRVPLSRLPAYETVFAMTVHKSQGSEFERVLLVLPREVSPVLTRELLYTAVTRARRAVQIIGPREVLRAGVAADVRRASGLRQRLWGPAEKQ